MSKSRQTPLYDLMMRSRPHAPPRRAVPEAVEREEAESPWWQWLTPGRAVRLPIGYVLIVVAGVVALLTTAFLVGYRRGDAEASSDFDQAVIEESRTALSSERPADPLTQWGSQGPLADAEKELGGGTALPPSSTDRPVSGRSRGMGPIESDPRLSGTMYFVLAETTRDGALRLAEFCRERGLETYVVGGHNTSLRRVVALPGFQSADRADADVKALEASIHSIGDQWKYAEPGASDLRDAYASRYR